MVQSLLRVPAQQRLGCTRLPGLTDSRGTRSMTSRYVEPSHPIRDEMITCGWLRGPRISTYVSRQEPTQRLGTGMLGAHRPDRDDRRHCIHIAAPRGGSVRC